nr:hypothetical protein [uncultured Desulfuromonas sp.]
MSIEYLAQTEHSITENQISKTRELLKKITTIELFDKQMENQITLRFTDIPKRETWPEDVTITFEDSLICLSFHSSSQDQREMLVKEMAELLANVGLTCEFDED